MIGYILRQWKTKKVTISLIILGFFVGCLVLSIGTSITIENYHYIQDMASGNPKSQLEITMESDKKMHSEDVEVLVNACSKYGEIQVLNMRNVTFDTYGDEYQVVLVRGVQESGWHLPLLEGRYFTPRKESQNVKEAIIGKEIAKKHKIKENTICKINGQEYKIIGIAGREMRETQWDKVVYLNDSEFIENNPSYVEEGTIWCVLKNGKDSFLTDGSGLAKKAAEKRITFYYEDMEEAVDGSSVTNALIVTIASSALIFTIAIINIINLMIYWIAERGKEFGIMKALGAHNGFVVKWVVIEVLLMTVISAVAGVLVQIIVCNVFQQALQEHAIFVSVSYINFIVSIGVAAVCGLIAAIVPAIRTIRIQPSEVMKQE